jgi:hypothetical protein
MIYISLRSPVPLPKVRHFRSSRHNPLPPLEYRINLFVPCPVFPFLSPYRDEEILVMVPPHTKGAVLSATKSLFEGSAAGSDAGGGPVSWSPRGSMASSSLSSAAVNEGLQSIRLPRGSGRVVQLGFHRKGDYFSSLCE